MKLYYAPGACSLAAHIVAAETGLKLDLEKVDLKTHKTESGADFRSVNRKGYVPALELDDGSLLTENGAILPFVAEQGGILPTGIAGFRTQEWISFINSEIHKSFGPFFMGAADAEKTKAGEKIKARLKLAEDALTGDGLMGDAFSAPDAYLYVMLRWCEKMGVDISALPRLTAFKARMDGRAGVKKALAEEGL